MLNIGQMNVELVQITKDRPRASWIARLYSAPLVHKFFLGGALFGVLGTAWLGVHLWLMLNGQIKMNGLLYLIFKHLHALIQIEFFLGFFIVGFYLQTAPKLFEIPSPAPRWALWLLAPMIAAGICLFVFPHAHIHRYLLALSYFSTAAILFTYYLRATLINRLRLGVLSIFGLCSLGVAPFFNLTDPVVALTIFWCGILAVVFAVSQQFIIWVLGGVKLEPRQSRILLLLFFSASASALLALCEPALADLSFMLFAILSLFTSTYFFVKTRALAISWRRLSEPLALAISLVQLWAIVGSLILLFGRQYADAVLHLWATGISITLILAVSSRVVGVIAGNIVFRSVTLIALILLWQVVVIGRGLSSLIALPTWFSWITGVCAILVFSIWCAAIFWRIAQILRRQFSLRKNEQMIGC